MTGDLSSALTTRQEISATLLLRLWNTLFLAFSAAIVSVPLAIILGSLAVRYGNGPIDKAITELRRQPRSCLNSSSATC